MLPLKRSIFGLYIYTFYYIQLLFGQVVLSLSMIVNLFADFSSVYIANIHSTKLSQKCSLDLLTGVT